MLFSEKIAANFKKTRLAYDFSIKNISDLLDLKTTSVIGNIETHKGNPSLNLLIKFALTFGVSIDWLLGFSDIIFTPASVSVAEKDLENRLSNTDTSLALYMLLNNYDKWQDPNSRQQHYSLAVRANIIALSNWVLQNPKPDLKNKLRYNTLENLVKVQSTNPIFNIENE